MTNRALSELDNAISEEGGWKLVKEEINTGREVHELLTAKRMDNLFTVTTKVTTLVTRVYERRE